VNRAARRIAIFALFALLAVAGCARSGDSSTDSSADGSAGKRFHIAVIPKGTTHEFWKSVHAGAQQAADELGNVEIYWKGPLQENDRDGQITVVQDFITKQVDGICLAPLDSQALVKYVGNAKTAGIPTVVFDSALADERDIVSYVATDNYQGGAIAARHMGKILGGHGGVILLRYNPGSESTEQRERGFLDTLTKEFPGIKVLSSDQYALTTPEEALTKSQQLLLKYRDQVDGVFTVCEPNSTGMLGALDGQRELAGKVKNIAFDPNAKLIAGMTDGTVHGIVLQDPVKMGYLAVKTMVEHLQGKPVEKRISTGEYIATPENMNDPQMHKLLHPAQFGE
jgi:ribose transport system substrate-binding protein